ncbi:MAG: DUF2721 domain-containing protein [Methylobacillus sp.]|jgi:hypothetical protein|nr:DUF2721 domain-containing protein [Methylobacillus sp.]
MATVFAAPETVFAVTYAIQQAVAPVFLLTGMSSLLVVLTNRLGRITDRTRVLEKMEEADGVSYEKERKLMARRARLVHWAISLCAFAALLICLVTAALFIGVELGWDPSGVIVLLFVVAMLAMIGGLLCFLHEIGLAMGVIQMRHGEQEKAA